MSTKVFYQIRELTGEEESIWDVPGIHCDTWVEAQRYGQITEEPIVIAHQFRIEKEHVIHDGEEYVIDNHVETEFYAECLDKVWTIFRGEAI